MTGDLRLSIAVLDHGQWDALKDGRVTPEGVELEHIDVDRPPMIYRRMVRGLEFDIAEVAITTYLCAKSFDIPITALPVFSNRDLTMAEIVVNAGSGIERPKDLEGKRVGMRSYTVTNNTQARALLRSEFGVDTDSVRWVVTEDAHVAQYKEPTNVELAPEGRTLEEMLEAGEIDAGIQLRSKPGGGIRLLLTEEERDATALSFYKRTGVYPIGHLMTVKDEVLDANPWVAGALFRAFAASKDRYVAGLDGISSPGARDLQSIRNRGIVGGDPLPFGLARNRRAMEGMVAMDVGQKIIPRALDVDGLFAAGTHDLE